MTAALDLVQHTARVGTRIAKEQRNAQADLNAALTLLRDDLPPQQFRPTGAYAPGDKPYVAISSSGHDTPAAAIEQWVDRFVAFVSEEPGDVIWWNARPTIAGEVDCETTEPTWTVYGRVAVGATE